MANTLNEIILLNDNLTGCIPPEVGLLKEVTVFDVSFNNLQGSLPASISQMKSVEHRDVAHNKLTGFIPASICTLPRLENFIYSFNYFTGEAPQCASLTVVPIALYGNLIKEVQRCVPLMTLRLMIVPSRLVIVLHQ
ncbi:hypothetical protein MKX01_034057 [Papaver californicum]|nr:hypothetical protein MKX01_034057 [Papaver californicum]